MRARNLLSILMKNKGHTLRSLAAETGIQHSVISDIRQGWRLPNDRQLEVLCGALGVTPEQIYPDDAFRAAVEE